MIGLIVICSALAGAAVERAMSSRMGPHGGAGGRGGGRGGGPGGGGPERSREMDQRRRVDMLDRMTKELNLTPVQRAGIDTVMQHTDSSLRAIRTEMQPRIESVFKSSRAAMDARLDSAQRVKLDSQMTSRRRRP